MTIAAYRKTSVVVVTRSRLTAAVNYTTALAKPFIATLGLCVLTALTVSTSASAEEVNKTITQEAERIEMLVQSSRILTLEGRIPKFQVHNELILGATPVAKNQIQVFAKAPGTTQVNLWDNDERLYTVDVTVVPDAREVEGLLASQLPYAALKVLPINGNAIVSGTVTSVDDVDRAIQIVQQFYPTPINLIRVVGVQQVLLHTRIMEVSRTKLRELGIDFTPDIGDGNLTYSAPGGSLRSVIDDQSNALLLGLTESGAGATNLLSVNDGFLAFIDALHENNLVKLLAEPTIVATHGRPARFNVGGRVPIITQTGVGAVNIQYEEFGTSIDFLPFVVGPGRIRLEVRPEVSEVDPALGVTLQGSNVPGFISRHVDTAVELQAGQTFALAGLIQTRVEGVTAGTPYLMNLPAIGHLFRRVRQRRNDIELLITVTPEFVSALDPHEAPCGGPGTNSTEPTNEEMYNRSYIEVPTLKEVDGCQIDGGCGDYTSPGGPIHYGSEISGGAVLVPSDPSAHQAIVPGLEEVHVGNGVSITAPQP
ncbi:MAG: pilus assembly protein N-terminal domain-containing protein [Planctomycetota bacterium]